MTRDTTVKVRMSDQGVEAIDKARGQWTRSEYIRRACSRAINGGDATKLRGPVTGEVTF